MRLSVSEDSEENDDGSLDEYNKDGNQPYRFKNLLIHGSKKVKNSKKIKTLEIIFQLGLNLFPI